MNEVESLKSQLAAALSSQERAERERDEALGRLAAYRVDYPDALAKLASAERLARERQARIDALMLEYCPEEMTQEQRDEWGRNQRSLSPEEEARIDTIVDAARRLEGKDG